MPPLTLPFSSSIAVDIATLSNYAGKIRDRSLTMGQGGLEEKLRGEYKIVLPEKENLLFRKRLCLPQKYFVLR